MTAEAMADHGQAPAAARRGWLIALVVVGAVVVAAAIWASADPDGLERVADDLGFIGAGQGPGFEILPGYTIPGLDGPLSTVVAGLVGVAIVIGLMLLLGRVLARRRR